jgi:hypothetical protein
MGGYYDMDYDQLAQENRWIDEGIKKGDPDAMYAAAQMAARFQNSTGAAYWRRQAEFVKKGLWKPEDELTYADVLKQWETSDDMPVRDLTDLANKFRQRGDQKGAALLFDFAAKLGVHAVQYEAAQFYLNTENSEKALYWLEKAAEQGEARYCFELGEMYAEGTGANADIQTAIKWYRKSGDYDSYYREKANEKLKAIGEDEIETPKEPEKDGYRTLTMDDLDEIAAILNKKYPRTDVLSLTDDKLLEMMDDSGLLDLLPISADERTFSDSLFMIKCAISRIVEGDGGYDVHQGDAWVQEV